jgi:ATP-binding cassette subfamily F protein 1
MDIINLDLDINYGKKIILNHAVLKIIHKQKYGLVGINGVGKSTVLNYINETYNHASIFMVTQEFNFDHNKSIYDIVYEANNKKLKWQQKIIALEPLIESNVEAFDKYTKLITKVNDDCEPSIRKILYGLGFSLLLQSKPFHYFSGGWRMRVALARALYMAPDLLLLDEPTNHIDLNAVLWLTNYLKRWKKTLIIVSHDIYILNTICHQMIEVQSNKLNYYHGNYDSFQRTKAQNNAELEKQWSKIQRRVKEMRNKSTKKETMSKFIQDNNHLQPLKEYTVHIQFPLNDPIKSPYIVMENITCGYDTNLFSNLNLTINAGDKMIIVGKNGVGKTTLLQLIAGKMTYGGNLTKNVHLKIGYYNQHLTESLPPNITPVAFLMQHQLTQQDARKYLGTIGLEGSVHLQLIETLSGGQKARVVLALINSTKPHLLLLDEPTNYLDVESIDALIQAINNYTGAIIMVTHNINIIEKTNAKILHLDNNMLHEVDFDDYYDQVIENL